MITTFLGSAIAIIRMTLRTRSFAFARLYFLSRRIPRYVRGVFRFSFGQVQYVDILSLLGQYTEIFIERRYEVSELGEAPYIIDCGGNIGLSVIWFKQHYPNARIKVFEADPAIADVLACNIVSLDSDHIELIRKAVSASTGTVNFQLEGADGGRVRNGHGVVIDSTRLSDHIDRIVDILKLDVEGSEFDIIKDLCISGKIELIRNIVCEVHGFAETQALIGSLWNDLANAGFRVMASSASIAEWMPGLTEPTPFPQIQSAKFLMQLYAWRQ